MDRYDVNERFARRHLSTRAERAAWLALSGQDSSLSAAQVAATTGLEEAEVQPVLGGFEAAGIVDTSWSTHHITYRCSMNMNYLFGGLAPSGWIDPVCGMPVHDDTPNTAQDVYGRKQLFCSSLCLAGFLAFRGYFSQPLARTVAGI
jgi:YHS domain-containing protein